MKAERAAWKEALNTLAARGQTLATIVEIERSTVTSPLILKSLDMHREAEAAEKAAWDAYRATFADVTVVSE